MKKIFIKISVGVILFSSLYAVSFAFAPINFNINPNGSSNLNPNIPKEKINFENGLENDPALRLKFRALNQVNKLLDSLNGAIDKINSTKYFTSGEKGSMKLKLWREKTRAEKIKEDIQKDQHFDNDKHRVFFDGLIDFLRTTSNDIPKAIGTQQVNRCKRILHQFNKVIDTTESYVNTVKAIDGNFNVDDAQSKVNKAKNKLGIVRNELAEINKILEKMDGQVGARQATEYSQQIDGKLKIVYKNIAEAKALINKSLRELEKVTGK